MKSVLTEANLFSVQVRAYQFSKWVFPFFLVLGLLAPSAAKAGSYKEFRTELWEMVKIVVADTAGLRVGQVTEDTVYFEACGQPTSIELFYTAKPFRDSYNRLLTKYGVRRRDTIDIGQAIFRFRGDDCRMTAGEVAIGLIRLAIE